jgi:hypothetical protein
MYPQRSMVSQALRVALLVTLAAHRRHPARVAVENRLGSRLSHEVLDVLQMSATSEHEREAAMPRLTPLSDTTGSAIRCNTQQTGDDKAA